MSALIPPAIRYLGSKFLCAEWIISHFPPHRAYCEPCGGSAAVLLNKPRAEAGVRGIERGKRDGDCLRLSLAVVRGDV